MRTALTMLLDKTYPLAPNGVFSTIQGEGSLLGTPMVFVRLAGCSIGCPQCDTDYRVHERLTASAIGERIAKVRGKASWIWVTGGEPADHDLWPLLEVCRSWGTIALATSGSKPLGAGRRLVNYLSVSPHGKPADLAIQAGDQINLVPGLNGLRLEDWEEFDAGRFEHRWVTPMGCGTSIYSVEECLDWIALHPGWKLGVQAHKTWGVA